MRIGLLLADFFPDEYAAIAGEYIEMFSAMLGTYDATLVPYDVYRRQLPEEIGECDGYIISGSRSAAYDGDEWISELENFIRESAAAEIPMFGICFGLQVMAEAFGGTVEEFDGGWGGGIRTMTVDQTRAWMTEPSGSISLIMSHQDQVVVLPADAVRLGSSPHCENFLVEFTPCHVGIQGHPEFNTAFAEAIYGDYVKTRGQVAKEALATLHRRTDSALVADWIWNMLKRS